MTEQPTEQVITLQHSMAGWAVFHPVSLRSRQKHPPYWWDHGFAITKEFAKGNLAAVMANMPDQATAVCRLGTLTEREQLLVMDTAVFRLKVSYRMVFFAPIDDLPCDRSTSIDPEVIPSFSLPNGFYRLSIHTIAWSEEPGAVDDQGHKHINALTDYVICFEPVDSFDEITVPDGIPQLMAVDSWPPNDRIVPRLDDGLSSSYPFVLVADQLPLPGVEAILSFSDQAQQPLKNALNRQDWTIVVSPADTTPGVGMVFIIQSIVGDLESADRYEVTGIGGKAVHIKGFAKNAEGWFVNVLPLHLLPSSQSSVDFQEKPMVFSSIARWFSKVDRLVDSGFSGHDPYEKAEQIELFSELKKQFIALIRQEGYPYPEFSIERIHAIETLYLLTFVVADELGFSVEDRLTLLKLPTDIDRAKMVLKRLSRALMS